VGGRGSGVVREWRRKVVRQRIVREQGSRVVEEQENRRVGE